MKIKKGCIAYHDIDWKKCNIQLYEKQNLLLTAWKKKDLNEVAMLQENIVRSFSARALAVRQVTSNKGKVTPGVDKITWENPTQKMAAIDELKNLKNYKASPVLRVYIPKSNKTLRPLGIPTMKDRSVQTLWTYALSPIAEHESDTRSYGFRVFRCTADAAVYLKLMISSYTATRRWVLEADIKKFFDTVDHNWLYENIPMKKSVLKQFLKAGFMEKNVLMQTTEGFPQGGSISPMIANMVLNGLQDALGKEYLTTRYADDFVVLGKTREMLQDDAIPRIKKFLKPRGLTLNKEKTCITNISDGFDFLGFNFREYPDKSRIKGTKQGIGLIKPSASKIKDFKKKLTILVRNNKKPLFSLIQLLNETLRGWAEYYCISTAKKVFSAVGKHMFTLLWKMIRKKHRDMPRRTLAKKYFTRRNGNNWVFTCNQSKEGQMTLYQIADTPIKRHIMCRALNYFELENKQYFLDRIARKARHTILLNKNASLLIKKQKGLCPVCNKALLVNEVLEIHHRKSKKLGGSDMTKNLVLLHKT